MFGSVDNWYIYKFIKGVHVISHLFYLMIIINNIWIISVSNYSCQSLKPHSWAV